MALTEKRIARAKPGKRKSDGEPVGRRYGDGNGLYLQVNKDGVKSWLLRYERDGRERFMGLGPLHTINLDEARERARKARLSLLDGIDPLEARATERAARAAAAATTITFAEAARAYFNFHERKWKNAKHRAQFLSTLETYAFPKIGTLPVAAIDTGAVLRCVEPIWPDKTETASRVRGRIEAVLDWATVRGYRSGDNPARWKGHLANVLPARGKIAKVEHHSALPFNELSDFMSTLRGREGTAARALEFTVLTAARTSEVIGATWDEIDFDAQTWTVPAGRIKGGKEHRVPLSSTALALLNELPHEDGNPFIFIGPQRGGLSNMAMDAVLKRMGYKDRATVHGFRSTFRDWAAETTAYPNHVVEQALAHVIGSKVEAAYRRSDLFDKRRRLMADWARYASTPGAKRSFATVSPIRGGGR
jgi:integrase